MNADAPPDAYAARVRRLINNAPIALELIRAAHAHWDGIRWPEDRAAIAQLAEAIALLEVSEP